MLQQLILTKKKSPVAEIPPRYVSFICCSGGSWKPGMCLFWRSINSTIEATVTIALMQSIGSVHIFCAKNLGFEFSCLQTFYNFFLFAVIINVFT